MKPPSERVAVLDFGSQYTQLIARRIRELGVYSEILPFDTPPEGLRDDLAVILSGGPASVYQAGAPLPHRELLALEKPLLGICYGLQVMMHALGGAVKKGARREYGLARLEHAPSPLFKNTPDEFDVWMSHGDRVKTLPDGFVSIGRSSNSPFAAVAHEKRPIFGLQFHPEVIHTEHGKEVLGNFVFGVAGAKGEWDMGDFIVRETRSIQERVGEMGVLLGLSGGVDSSVLAALLAKAVGGRLHPVFVDTGLLRKGERERMERLFGALPNIRFVDAAERFLAALRGIREPEAKRKTIGETFIRVFEKEAQAIGGLSLLAQGTLYPDVIESNPVMGPSATIKSHHNVGGLPEKMGLALLEPFRWLFKDEIREIGRLLGVPAEILGRHPFPGPGMAVRVAGEVTPRRLAAAREADAIVVEEIGRTGLYDQTWQAFAVLLDVKSVGVMGDERTYEEACAVRVVNSEDGMTADFTRLPWEVLERVGSRIVNEVNGINRVLYDITTKPPGTIEWE